MTLIEKLLVLALVAILGVGISGTCVELFEEAEQRIKVVEDQGGEYYEQLYNEAMGR